MSWIPSDLGFTVEQLIRAGLSIDEACWVAWNEAPAPKSLCCVCEAARATYWNYRDQPFCGGCAG